MAEVLEFPRPNRKETTTPGGFFVDEAPKGDGRDDTVAPRKAPPTPDEIAEANTRVNTLMADPEFLARRARGCEDVVKRRDTPDAAYYREFEGLLDVANAAYDRPSATLSSSAAATVTHHALGSVPSSPPA
ncbi:hypothetical protein E6P97_04090 [Patescibacteria group bacterium]|nr:MAG: hypothetical protein E6P97_04090 [Patescibacteria group bacterium]